METAAFDYWSWIILPVLIFTARLMDVTLATLRHILIYKNARAIVPALAFVEVTIWLLAISQIMQNLSNWACFIGFAGGFSAGTYAGMVIEEKLALGYQLVRIVTEGNSDDLLSTLTKNRFGVTRIKAAGSMGNVEVFLVVSERRKLKDLLAIIKSMEPVPFYTIEDVRSVGIKAWAKNTIPGAFAFEGSIKRK